MFAVGDGIVGVMCSETTLGEGWSMVALDACAVGAGGVVVDDAVASGLGPCGAGGRPLAPALEADEIGGFEATALVVPPLRGCSGTISWPKLPDVEPFLFCEWNGVLDFLRPGSDRRLDDARKGPGGGM